MMMNFDGWHMGPGWGMMGYGAGLGLLSWLVPLGVVVILFAALWGQGERRRFSDDDHSRSLEILKERYAKGEITKEEFERMKKDLS
jgi:putative membrane protein